MADPAQQQRATRIAVGWVLAAIVLGFAAFNTAMMSLMADANPWEELEATILGAWGFEPMLFGIWAALGPGRIVIRLPLILPCLMLIVAAPGLDPRSFGDVNRFEFVVLMVAAFAVFAVATLILLILRSFISWRIELLSDDVVSGDEPFQFDTMYLIALITVYALALGITFNLKFGPADPPGILFGPNFYVYVMAIGSAIISLLNLPILAVPLAILKKRPLKDFILRAAVCWLVASLVAGALWLFLQEGKIEKELAYLLLIQFGAAVAGFGSAWPLRWAGCRLVNIKPLKSLESKPIY